LVVWIFTFFYGDRWGNLAGLIFVFFLAIVDAKGRLRELIKVTREGGLKVGRRLGILRGKVAGTPVSVDSSVPTISASTEPPSASEVAAPRAAGKGGGVPKKKK